MLCFALMTLKVNAIVLRHCFHNYKFKVNDAYLAEVIYY